MSSVPMPKRKTKIVATIGPASRSREVIRQLIEAGIDVARMNFSHGTHEEHTVAYNYLREESERAGRPVAIFQDLCGPKVRVGEIEGGETILKAGEKIELRHATGEKGSDKCLYVEAFDPVTVIQVGEKALLADGRIELIATAVAKDHVSCVVQAGGLIRSRSGIAVPDSRLELPCVTPKDEKDIVWAAEHKVDYVALSFVGSAKDIFDLRSRLTALGANIPIIAKVERAWSLDNITSIVEASDSVMVARGDLGLELPLERVPSAQRLIIQTSNFNGTPVITATQMLMSMVKEIRPTRAEVTDVTTAVRDGTDAVMLSEETAVGEHPVLAVRVLDRILLEAEQELHFEKYLPRLKSSDREKVSDAICYAACNAADKISASAIIACTQSGHTARLLSKYRPRQVLFGATTELRSLRRMALYWGVEPVLISVEENFGTEDEVTQAMVTVRENYGLKPGARIVVTAGLRTKKAGSTNLMEIREIPRS